MSDELEPLRRLRPDNLLPDDPATPRAFAPEGAAHVDHLPRARNQHPHARPLSRLAYADEFAALDYLVRVFGFTELREARMEHEWDGRTDARVAGSAPAS